MVVDGVGFFESVKELSRINTAQRIGRKVAHNQMTPMYVLHNAFEVVFWGDAEIFGVFLIPDFGQLGYRDVFVDYHFFHFITDDDVEIVGDFVGVYAYHGRLALVCDFV